MRSRKILKKKKKPIFFFHFIIRRYIRCNRFLLILVENEIFFAAKLFIRKRASIMSVVYRNVYIEYKQTNWTHALDHRSRDDDLDDALDASCTAC